MMALVRGVMAASTSAPVVLKVAGSRSTKTGLAPRRETTPAVAKKVKVGTITSSPAPMPSAMRATNWASVPLLMPTAKDAPA